MNSIFDDYSGESENQYLYILPVERLTIKNKEKINDVTIYPAGYIDIDELMKNVHFFSGQEVIEKQLMIFKENTIIAFSDVAFHAAPASILSNEIIVRKSVEKVSCLIDYLKFRYCKLAAPKTMPGRIGQISTGESLMLMFHRIGSPLTRIINEPVFVNTLTIGNGLKIYEENPFKDFNLLSSQISEIGYITKHALRLYSGALEENGETEKFIQIMRLFEYIANPTDYEKFQSVRTKVSAHIAKNIHDIHRLSSEFRYYSSGENQDGLRTEIIHKGKNLDEIIHDISERRSLFHKLQEYLHCCINDLLDNYNKTWPDLEQLRETKRECAENDRQQTKHEMFSETIVIIDGNCLNEAIKKYKPLYKKIYQDKELEKISIANLCFQMLSNTRRIEKRKTFGFFIFYYDIDCLDSVIENFECLNEVRVSVGEYRFEIHTIKNDSKAEMINRVVLFLDDITQDRCLHNNMSSFENIVFCGDRVEYVDSLRNIVLNRNKNVTVIKDSHSSEMNISLTYFDTGHLVGMSLGLAGDEV